MKLFLSKIQKNRQIIVIIALSLVLRIISLNQSLWWDEAINVVYAKASGFWYFVTQYTIADFHPPGYFALLWLWGRLFSFSEISVRIPSVLFGVAVVFLTYLVAKELFSKKVGLISALFLAVAPLDIYYSQEARMYSFAAFAAALSMYFLIKLLQNSRFAILGLAISTTLVLYSDYVAYFIFPAQFLYLFLFQKKFFRKFFVGFILGIIPLLPWSVSFLNQFKTGLSIASGLPGWKEVVGGANLKDLGLLVIKTLIGRISLDNKLFYGLILALIGVPYVIVLTKFFSRFKKIPLNLTFWLVIPPLLAFGFSFIVPIFSYFRFIFILPAFYILIAWAADQFPKIWALVLTIFLVIVGLLPSMFYLLDNNFQREDWRGAIEFVQSQANKDQNLVLFETNDMPAPVIYYATNLSGFSVGLKKVPARSESDVKDLTNQKKDIYVFEYLADVTDPNRVLEKKILEMGYSKIKIFNFRGVGFVSLYSKTLLE